MASSELSGPGFEENCPDLRLQWMAAVNDKGETPGMIE